MFQPDDQERSAVPDRFNLQGRVFDMVSSTSSRVDPVAPTRFTYYESGGVLWGHYSGDTVDLGRFCGARRDDVVDIAFVHRNRDGETIRGSARSRIDLSADGLLQLTEDFTGPDGAAHVSVCREVAVAQETSASR
ncbi:hypothetical protein [Phytoactinopolyspora limicola]|uniref:hypothetical protein n=1 Tax=Phytoactinopolyspora limicola TaxID=2715536 RepID=UPI00140BE828|nr:hypothetical protein [Phytoactinopolyspora limicola]